MRPEFLVPDELTAEHPTPYARELVQDLLSIVGVQLPAPVLNRWTRFELIVAADWATREHCVASDYPRRMLRDKPRFVLLAEAASDTHLGKLVRATYGEGLDQCEVAEGIMLATRSDGAVAVQQPDGLVIFCAPLLDFEIIREPVRAGAR